MKKINLNKQFSYRLREAMLAAGLDSKRSPSGVCIQKLVEITGYSIQICRKYLRGEAIPEPTKLLAIAKELHVSPGWLLFGEKNNAQKKECLSLSKTLLHYIFTQARSLYNTQSLGEEIADFLLDLVENISQIDATDQHSKQIIDLALTSVKRFR